MMKRIKLNTINVPKTSFPFPSSCQLWIPITLNTLSIPCHQISSSPLLQPWNHSNISIKSDKRKPRRIRDKTLEDFQTPVVLSCHKINYKCIQKRVVDWKPVADVYNRSNMTLTIKRQKEKDKKRKTKRKRQKEKDQKTICGNSK